MTSSFGALLRELRRDAGFTQEQLADRAAISSQAVGALERGARRFPHQHTVTRLADALGLADDQRAAFVVAAARPSAPPAQREPEVTTESPVRVPRQLPPPTPLTGREPMIAEVAAHLIAATDPSPVLLVGPGGIGKTALAVAIGHQLAPEFPDGQLFADLRGAQPDPVDAYAVLGRFLRALGVPKAEVPADPDERLAAYRSALAGRRMLLVLDDAATEEQVRPLLPPPDGCATVVTSRRQLGALLGATRWTVPALDSTDAVRLLARIAGDARIADEPTAATQVADACGYSPLAICIAAGRLAVRPHWTVAELGRRLTAEHGRLDALSVGDLDVRASIGLSYQSLRPEQRRLLRRLGLVWTKDWPAWVADELFQPASPPHSAEDDLDELVNVHLVEAIGADAVGQQRFRLHDLIAEFARERAYDEESPGTPERIVADLLRSWTALAAGADEDLGHGFGYGTGLTLGDAPAQPAETARLAPGEWFDAERGTLVTAVGQAIRLGHADVAGTLALRLAGFLRVRGHRDDHIATLRQALAAVRAGGLDELRLRVAQTLFSALLDHDLDAGMPELTSEMLAAARALGQADLLIRALVQAGLYAKRRGRLGEAIGHYEDALAACSDESRMLATALAALALAYTEAGRPHDALPLSERAVALQRGEGAPVMIALRLLSHAEVLADAGRPADAETALREALALSRATGHDAARAYAEWRLGDLALVRGRWRTADRLIRSAVATFDRLRDAGSTAYGMRSLGDLAMAQGRPQAAITPYQDALATWQRLRLPLEAARMQARLGHAWYALADHGRAAEHRAAGDRILADLGLTERALRLGLAFHPARTNV
ncbi:helix-turn-helix domain-containing protein [Hamadaea sp. NPDC051192]|uniref:ATP-binding protein n=1 Tax=Hamadaea sp. NPDC051192 TaxID=3154940 RepID=UPI0034412657